MRMWNVPPELMCRQHLLGEHLELHMFANAIEAKKRIEGFFNGLVDTSLIKKRHDQVVAEMLRRGYRHESPLDYKDELRRGRVDAKANLAELKKRCKACKERQNDLKTSRIGNN